MPILQLARGNLDDKFNATVTKLEKTFHKHGFEVYRDQMIDEIATIVPGDRSALLQVGMLIDGSGYNIVALTEGAHYGENPPRIIGQCGYQKLNLFALKWAEFQDDLSKALYLESIPDIVGGKVTVIPLLEVLKLLKANGICLYDGLPFFHPAHKVDPFDDKSGVHPNLIYQPLTSDGWDAVLQSVITRPAPGSRLADGKAFLPNRGIATDGKKLVLYTGHTSIASRLAKIFDPSAFWNPGTNLATETRRVFANATVQYCPEMAVLDDDADDYIYGVLKNTAQRGVLVRVPDPPMIKRSKDGSDDDVDKDVKKIKAVQTFGACLTDPWRLFKWKFTAPT